MQFSMSTRGQGQEGKLKKLTVKKRGKSETALGQDKNNTMASESTITLRDSHNDN